MQVISQNINSWSELFAKEVDVSILHYSFDFWHTIVIPNPKFKIERAEFICNKIKQDLTTNQINAAFEKVGKEYNNKIESGFNALTPIELYKKVFEALNCIVPNDIESFVKDIDVIFLRLQPSIDFGFVNYYEKILAHGKTFSITSNTAFISGNTIREFLASSGLITNFNFLLFSDEFGYGKPNDKIFNQLIVNVKEYNPGILDNQILHIGDNYKSDIWGAKNSGINAIQIKLNESLFYPRFAAHSIMDRNNVPINPVEYSKFKFGDTSIANKYGEELFEYFISNLLPWLKKKNGNIIVYSSPYSNIPTSSYYLTRFFLDSLALFLENSKNDKTTLQFGKINRCQTYTEDYGALSAEQRYNLIKNDTYNFYTKPNPSDRIIFIDDISITGTHQRVIEKTMKENRYYNDSIFLYHSKLDNPNIEPTFENELNFSSVNSINSLLDIIYSEYFDITTRAIKFILKSQENDFNCFLLSLINNNRIDLLEKIYLSSNDNGYNTIEEYSTNYFKLNNFITNK